MAASDGGPLLGTATRYPDRYAPELLVSIPRQPSRARLGLSAPALPFSGFDYWTAYELSWLNRGGKPQVAIAEFRVPCDSTFIVESKSFKLYLNSLNQVAFDAVDQLQLTLARDLGIAFSGEVGVRLYSPEQFRRLGFVSYTGTCIDELPVACDCYQPDPGLLSVATSESVSECLYSHLLKTNCPVTGQPDWATALIRYTGPRIEPESLLRYLVSFRQHQDFHENSVERIFIDLLTVCAPEQLEVFARYTRRGGLDINPCRSTGDVTAESTGRTARQ